MSTIWTNRVLVVLSLIALIVALGACAAPTP